MKPAAMLGCQIRFGGLAVLICSFFAALAPGHVVCADEAPAVAVPSDVTASEEILPPAPLLGAVDEEQAAPRDSKAADEGEANAAPAAQAIVGEQPAQVILHFKFFNVSKKRAAEAGIDLAAILAPKPRDASSRENSAAASPNADAVLSTISLREDELLTKLVTVTGAAKLLAEPTLVTVEGRKAKFHSGAEISTPGPTKDGVVATEFRDIGTKIEVTVRLGDPRTVRAELRAEYSELDPSRTVTADGVAIPAVRRRCVHVAVPLAIGETTVLGGPRYDDFVVMVTPELVVPSELPDTLTLVPATPGTRIWSDRIAGHNEPEHSALSSQMQQLQSTIETLQVTVKELAALMDNRPAANGYAASRATPSLLPSDQYLAPTQPPTRYAASVDSAAQPGNDQAVKMGWEQSPAGESIYTIRIPSVMHKSLIDGSAVEVRIDRDSRKLHEFRVMMGHVLRPESSSVFNASEGVDYGWRPSEDGGLDYFVQVSPEQLEVLSKGSTLNCKIPPDVPVVDRIYVFMGTAKLPRDAAP